VIRSVPLNISMPIPASILLHDFAEKSRQRLYLQVKCAGCTCR
jgi:hypothetical protein